MVSISSILQSQFDLFQANSTVALQRIKQAQAIRFQKEYEAISEKYDGSEQAVYEDKLAAAADAKAAAVMPLSQVKTALGKIDDIRNKLLEMRSAASLGSSEAFDYAYSTLTTMTGSAWLDKDNLMSNNRTVSNTWPDTNNLISAGGFQVSVPHYFLGNDYSIELSNGDTLRPNPSTSMLDGTGDGIAFADISNQVITGDQISFDAGGVTYTGTLHQGGGGVMNAWAYGNFTGTDADTQKALAMSNIDDALERVRKAETYWGIAETQLNSVVDRLGDVQDQAKADFEKVSYEVLDAKNAELKAAKSRYELSTNSLALTSGQATNFIQQMFMAQPIGQSKGLFDIIGGY